ncbi:MAG: PQQ-dependent sugar dehydrogenase [Ilumatobacteraceae bacterium]
MALFVAACTSDDDGGGVASVPIGTGGLSTTTSIVEATVPSSDVGAAPTATTTTTTASSATSSSAPVIPTTRPTSTTPPEPSSIAFVDIGHVAKAVNVAFRAGDATFYVVSQNGLVVALRAGPDGMVVDDTAVLDISDAIIAGGERGLLGLAFSVDGSRGYVDATNLEGDTEIAEYAVGADGVFDPASRRLLLTIEQPYSNHNGGQLRVGLDGYLYIALGDGGGGGDSERRGLDNGELLGKILRIDTTASGESPYSIPPDNPFIGVAGARAEIWSFGLRNPWRFSFDLATNDLWIADVGQGKWEEIDVAWADEGGGRAANFGWSAFEGTHRFNDDQPVDGVIAPIWEYEHGARGCSVSGGVRYRGAAIPALYGYYVYADYCSGEVRAIEIRDDRTAGGEVILTGALSGLSEVAQGPDGELYVLSVTDGVVYAVVLS